MARSCRAYDRPGLDHTEIETEIELHKGDRERIIVTELPYQVNKARLIERIAELVKDKKIEGISIYATNQTVKVCGS